MIRRFHTALLASLALTAAAPATSHASASMAEACPGAYSQPQQGDKGRITSATLCTLNYEREVHHLQPLRHNSQLASAAERHTRDMVERDYFSHDTQGGGSFVSRISAAHYIQPGSAWDVGENLAWGTGQLGTPASTLEGWMHSPAHRANILNGDFREVGIGVELKGDKVVYTTDFGRRG
jgi:uncharacterized protein YkwD